MWAVPDVTGAGRWYWCVFKYLCMRLRVQCQWVNGIKSYRSDIDLLVHRVHVAGQSSKFQWRSEENDAELLFAAQIISLFRLWEMGNIENLKPPNGPYWNQLILIGCALAIYVDCKFTWASSKKHLLAPCHNWWCHNKFTGRWKKNPWGCRRAIVKMDTMALAWSCTYAPVYPFDITIRIFIFLHSSTFGGISRSRAPVNNDFWTSERILNLSTHYTHIQNQ